LELKTGLAKRRKIDKRRNKGMTALSRRAHFQWKTGLEEQELIRADENP
jgi:hypothetical protein